MSTSCYLVSSKNCPLPDDEEKVSLPESLGIKNNYKDFEKIGYKRGNKISDFTLYSVDGSEFILSKALKDNKLLLLISGSYTCDITRRNIVDINAIAYKYKSRLNSYFVYTIDAHPSDVASPYSKKHQIELALANSKDHIEAKQPKTYGERKALAKKCQQENTLLLPTLVDEPDNNFWLTFGQAPNMAYLIEPDGTVRYRQTWFKFNDLDTVIGNLLRK